MGSIFTSVDLCKLVTTHPSITSTGTGQLNSSPTYLNSIMFSYYKNKLTTAIRQSYESVSLEEMFTPEEKLKLVATVLVSLLIAKAKLKTEEDSRVKHLINAYGYRDFFQCPEGMAIINDTWDELKGVLARHSSEGKMVNWMSLTDILAFIKRMTFGDITELKSCLFFFEDMARTLDIPLQECITKSITIFKT